MSVRTLQNMKIVWVPSARDISRMEAQKPAQNESAQHAEKSGGTATGRSKAKSSKARADLDLDFLRHQSRRSRKPVIRISWYSQK